MGVRYTRERYYTWQNIVINVCYVAGIEREAKKA